AVRIQYRGFWVPAHAHRADLVAGETGRARIALQLEFGAARVEDFQHAFAHLFEKRQIVLAPLKADDRNRNAKFIRFFRVNRYAVFRAMQRLAKRAELKHRRLQLAHAPFVAGPETRDSFCVMRPLPAGEIELNAESADVIFLPTVLIEARDVSVIGRAVASEDILSG